MNLEALFKISHGVYITGARDTNNRLIGSCIDTAMVIEVAPAQIMISLCKGSFTCQNILKTHQLSLSILPEDSSDEIIKNFGMQTSETVDKWDNVPYLMHNNLPVLKESVAHMSLSVDQEIETATHWVLLCTVETIEAGSMKTPLLYENYQNRKRKGTKMSEEKKWVCSVCGYVYDGDIPFEELPDDWVCPLCGEPKSVFVQE